MKYTIKNTRGEVIFEGDDLRWANLRDANLRYANLRDANLYGADLRYANLYGADLRDANLYGADLRDADLRDADLYGADLRDADLYGADLYGADLRDATGIIHLGCRSDHYEFYTQSKEGATFIKAGCRYFTLDEAKKHWKDTRGGTNLGDESLAFVEKATLIDWSNQ